MRWWDSIFHRGRSAQDWDAPGTEDETVAELKALFEAAREDAPEPDEKLWEKLRPQLAAHEGQARSAFPFMATLAAAGPRFAVAALGVLLIVASLFWTQGVERRARIQERQTELALYTGRNPLNPNIVTFGSALEAQSGHDLLRFVAYSPSER
ncbi:MAG: hypothetical protein OXL41_11035 [Nitrospinae bacterium]|nr:hypothetical protein [Nitrospinota bacterium]